MMKLTIKAGRTKRDISIVPGETTWGLKRRLAREFFGRKDVPAGRYDGRTSAGARMTLTTAQGIALADGAVPPVDGIITMTVAPEEAKMSPDALAAYWSSVVLRCEPS